MLAGVAFGMALLAAVAMGLALQRGATCTVAAMDELVNQGSARRALALLEAALWVGAGLVVAQALGLRPNLPPTPVLGWATVFGAMLLGLGALINGTCVFGSVARLGTGEWAYLATPFGFYAGCVSVLAFLPRPAALSPGPVSNALLFSLPTWAVTLVATAAVLRLALGFLPGWNSRKWRDAWSPHNATALIGLAFLALFLLAGAWSYTDVLAELAQSMAQVLPGALTSRLALAGAVLAGALLGGWATGQWQRQLPGAAALARCFTGGGLMGCGSMLVPGGNDSLILLGLPLLWPHAWASVAIMCAVICAVLRVQRRFRQAAIQA